jgi:CBS-domain-containing membrane protein
MTASGTRGKPVRLILDAKTAADLMAPNPVSIAADATIKEAVGFLVDRAYSAAPVIDEAGTPVGVVSQSDIVIHDRARSESTRRYPSSYEQDSGSSIGDLDRTRVREIMTPVVLSVTSEAPAHQVVQEMLKLKVHRLFVVDKKGVLIGVISPVDILKHLHPE